MTSEKPRELSEDDVQSRILQAVHDALADAAPISAPADERPLAEMKQDEPPLQEVSADVTNTEVELDRIARYLRGPTAFTA